MTIFRALLALVLAAPGFAQVRVVPALTVSGAPAVVAPASLPTGVSLTPALVPSLPAASAPELPGAPVPAASPVPVPARTASVLRDDADRLYASLAAIHSKVKAGQKEADLKDLKQALAGDFDGVARNLKVEATGDDLRAEIKSLRAKRARAEKALAKAPAEARLEASKTLAAVSGELGARQLKAARELLAANSPLNNRPFRRNAALWALVGAHNSAAAAAAEASYIEALAHGEDAFGDGRPYLYWSKWRNLHAILDDAARDARNGRAAKAAEKLDAAAKVLAATRDAQDAVAAAELKRLAASPESAGILAAKSLVKHPALKARTPVAYEDLDASLRALVHALDSGRKDYLETAGAVAELQRAAALLSGPRPSAADVAQADRLLEPVLTWAKRGRVDAKRSAALNLESASAAMTRGDLKLAAKHIGWAADGLETRRGDIRRIGLAVRTRLLRALGA